MSKWFAVGFILIFGAIYRSYFDPTLLGSLIVGGISGAIGGIIGEMYDKYLGKFDYNITYFIDNILWLIVFCVPGALLGSIVDSIVSYLINGTWDNPIHGTTILIVMILVSVFFTYKKMRSKQRKRFQQDQNESVDL